ncbi:MAG: hypothetical protein O7D91_01560 [Planctomycetota bacterium]|nr:hypothetical protein [Planctomycetota bacterium]
MSRRSRLGNHRGRAGPKHPERHDRQFRRRYILYLTLTGFVEADFRF